MDLKFVITSGRSPFDYQSLLLIKSITYFYHKKSILVYLPKEEKQMVSQEILNELRKYNLHYIRIPIREYPISSKIESLRRAQIEYKNSLYIMLDTDMLMLNQLPKLRLKLGLTPVMYGSQIWATRKSIPIWKQLYKEFGFSLPKRHNLKTMIDKRKMYFPYYNAGVVLTTYKNFGKQWLKILKEIYYKIAPYQFNADQVALSLLASSFEITHLSERYNYSIFHFKFPKNIIFLHYPHWKWLYKISKINNYQNILDKIGVKIEKPTLTRRTVKNVQILFRTIKGRLRDIL